MQKCHIHIFGKADADRPKNGINATLKKCLLSLIMLSKFLGIGTISSEELGNSETTVLQNTDCSSDAKDVGFADHTQPVMIDVYEVLVDNIAGLKNNIIVKVCVHILTPLGIAGVVLSPILHKWPLLIIIGLIPFLCSFTLSGLNLFAVNRIRHDVVFRHNGRVYPWRDAHRRYFPACTGFGVFCLLVGIFVPRIDKERLVAARSELALQRMADKVETSKLQLANIVTREWAWTGQTTFDPSEIYTADAFITLLPNAQTIGAPCYWGDKSPANLTIEEYYCKNIFIDEQQYDKRPIRLDISEDLKRACLLTCTKRRRPKILFDRRGRNYVTGPDNIHVTSERSNKGKPVVIAMGPWSTDTTLELWCFEKRMGEETKWWRCVRFSGGYDAAEGITNYESIYNDLNAPTSWKQRLESFASEARSWRGLSRNGQAPSSSCTEIEKQLDKFAGSHPNLPEGFSSEVPSRGCGTS